MPLVVICGIPCSGKTRHAQLLEKHFVESGKKVHLINEESLHITKADGYKGTPLSGLINLWCREKRLGGGMLHRVVVLDADQAKIIFLRRT